MLALTWVSGCAHPPPAPPFVAPQAGFDVEHHAAPVASTSPAPTTTVSDTTSDAIVIRIQIAALESRPSAPGQPAASEARLVTRSSGAAPLQFAPRLTQATIFISPDGASAGTPIAQLAAPGRTAVISEARDLLPRGVAARYTVRDPHAITDPLLGAPTFRTVSLTVNRADRDPGQPPMAEIALTVHDVDMQPDASQQGSEAEPKPSERALPRFVSETLFLKPIPIAGPREVALLLPFRFAGSGAWGVALVIRFEGPSNDPRDADRAARLLADARRSGSEIALPASTQPAADAVGITAAIDAAAAGREQRAMLAFAAQRAGARLCLDFALTANPSTLSQFCGRLGKQPAGAPLDPPAARWLLDRSCLAFCSELMGAEKLPPELAGVLATYAGEAGRHQAALDEALRGATGSDELQTRLVAENVIFLEDSSPASRVRAFDWLAARGHAPAGFDPLGPARDRRAALANFNPVVTGGAP